MPTPLRRIVIWIISSVMVIAWTAEGRCNEDEFWTNDRKAHAIGSGLIAGIAYIHYRERRMTRAETFFAAAGTAFVLASLKEIVDPNPSEKDLAANAIGSFAMPLLIVCFDW